MLLSRAGDDEPAQGRPGWLGEGQSPTVLGAAQERETPQTHTPSPAWGSLLSGSFIKSFFLAPVNSALSSLSPTNAPGTRELFGGTAKRGRVYINVLAQKQRLTCGTVRPLHYTSYLCSDWPRLPGPKPGSRQTWGQTRQASFLSRSPPS